MVRLSSGPDTIYFGILTDLTPVLYSYDTATRTADTAY